MFQSAREEDQEESESEDEVEDDNAVATTDKENLVLVQHNKYKWPGLMVGKEGAAFRKVRLFDKQVEGRGKGGAEDCGSRCCCKV